MDANDNTSISKPGNSLHASALRVPYRILILSPATIAICILLLKMFDSVRKKNRGKKGKKKPATTPLNRVVYMPVLVEDMSVPPVPKPSIHCSSSARACSSSSARLDVS